MSLRILYYIPYEMIIIAYTDRNNVNKLKVLLCYVTCVTRVSSLYGRPNVNFRQVGVRRNIRYTCSKLDVMTGVVEVKTERQVEQTQRDDIVEMHDKNTEHANGEGTYYCWQTLLNR